MLGAKLKSPHIAAAAATAKTAEYTYARQTFFNFGFTYIISLPW